MKRVNCQCQNRTQPWFSEMLRGPWKTFSPSPARLLPTFTQLLWNNLNKAVILYNGPSNPNWQLQPHPCLKYGPTCHFSCADSSWHLRGTTTDWEYMTGSLSDDSTGKMESCDVMETRLLLLWKRPVCLLQFTTIHIQDPCLRARTVNRLISTSVSVCLCGRTVYTVYIWVCVSVCVRISPG